MKNTFYSMLSKVITTKAYGARTVSSDPLQSFMFRVSIPGIPSQVGFQKVGGLSREVAVVEYLENMYEHAHKLAGRETVGEVTFERGMYADKYMLDVYKKIFTSPSARNTVTINICDRVGTVRRTFNCAEAWFSKYETGDLDATSDDVLIETLTMQFEYFLD